MIVSCTKEIIIDLDKHESKLVVNSFFSPSNGININLSKSIPVLDKDRVNFIKNAEVQFYCHSELVSDMNYLGDGKYYLNTSIVKGKEYSISINAPGFKSVTARSVVPDQPQFLLIDTIFIDDELLYCEIEFFNDSEALNYYLLEVESKYPIIKNDSIQSNKLDIINSDMIVENGDLGEKLERLVFSGEILKDSVGDLGFALNKKTLFDSYTGDSNTLYIHFKKISEEYYLYLKSFYESKSRLDEIYTNTDNGYGIFAAYNVTLDSIVIRKDN